jgi:hypothetical protein
VKLKRYISEIKKDLHFLEQNLKMNIPIKFDFIDLNHIKHTLKPIIYKEHQINLFYELEGEEIGKKIKNKIDKYEDSEVRINDVSNN